MPARLTVSEALVRHIRRSGPDDCWPYTGTIRWALFMLLHNVSPCGPCYRVATHLGMLQPEGDCETHTAVAA